MSAPSPFQHGDLVQLKSGGLKMVFNRLVDDDQAEVFLSTAGDVVIRRIPVGLLMLAPAKPEAN